MEKVLFLDRDGTLIRDIMRPPTPEEVELLPGVGQALHYLQGIGYRFVVVTNQAAIGRLILSEAEFRKQNEVMKRLLLDEHGVKLDRIYHCPHTPQMGCNCRKPKPYMIIHALHMMRLWPLRKSFYMVGDKWSDVRAGRDAGVKPFQIKCNTDGLLNLVAEGKIK